MNTSKKSKIIMDELLEIVGGSTVGNHPSTTPDQTTVTLSNSKDPVPLTVQDVLNQLTEMVRENPAAAEYQIAEYSYDDFAVGPANSLFLIKGIIVIDLPKNSEDEFVENTLTSDKIAVFHS